MGLALVDPPLCGGLGSCPSFVLLLGKGLALAFACRLGRDTAPGVPATRGPLRLPLARGFPRPLPLRGDPQVGPSRGDPQKASPDPFSGTRLRYHARV